MAGVRRPFELGPQIAIRDIPGALRSGREALARASGDLNALRVCTLNLVGFCHDEDHCQNARDVLGAMVAEHPGRLFLVHAHVEVSEGQLYGRVAIDGTPMGPGVPPTYSELIDIYASGAQVDFLPSILTSLLESDQPACAWWYTAPVFGPSWECMTRSCDRMVVDSSQLDPWDLMRLAEFVKRDSPGRHTDDHAALGDLGWARVKPFMALCARFFESPLVRERFAEVERVVVRHAPPTGATTAVGAAMLGAWVRDRLQACAKLARVQVAPQVELSRVSRPDLAPGEVSELLLLGNVRGPLELSVSRPAGNDAVVAEARQGLSGLPSQRRRLHPSTSWLLAQELQTYRRDPLFERALLGAIDILREARR